MQRVRLFVEGLLAGPVPVHIYGDVKRPAPAPSAVWNFNRALNRRVWMDLAFPHALGVFYRVKNSTHILARWPLLGFAQIAEQRTSNSTAFVRVTIRIYHSAHAAAEVKSDIGQSTGGCTPAHTVWCWYRRATSRTCTSLCTCAKNWMPIGITLFFKPHGTLMGADPSRLPIAPRGSAKLRSVSRFVSSVVAVTGSVGAAITSKRLKSGSIF